MMFALYSTAYYSESQETITVYGILILGDGRIKAYKTMDVKTGPTPIIVYRCLGIKIEEDSLDVCDIIEYIFKYTFEYHKH